MSRPIDVNGLTTSNMLKCASCNLVINEVLAFIQNKCDVMDEDSMIRLCTTAFKSEEISAAKNLLFTSVKTSGRKINRQRDGKTRREIEDIIALIKQTDPEEMPIFVARDLQKLPPVTFDHLDATRLLKDLILLKHEIETIKEIYTPMDQFSRLQNEVINLQQTSRVNDFERDSFVNGKRVTTSCLLDTTECNCESGPSDRIHVTHEPMSPNNHSNNSTNIIKEVDQHTQALQSQFLSRSRAAPTPFGVDLSVTHSPDTARAAMLSEKPTRDASTSAMTNALVCVSATNNQLISELEPQSALFTQNADNDWQVVQRKRYRNRFVGKKGTCTEINESFKAANITVPLFINNVHKETSENHIVSYIKSKTNVEITLQRIEPKQQRQYNSYKMYVPKEKLSLFMDCSIWPDGITFRRFVDFSRRDIDRRKKYDNGVKINQNG